MLIILLILYINKLYTSICWALANFVRTVDSLFSSNLWNCWQHRTYWLSVWNYCSSFLLPRAPQTHACSCSIIHCSPAGWWRNVVLSLLLFIFHGIGFTRYLLLMLLQLCWTCQVDWLKFLMFAQWNSVDLSQTAFSCCFFTARSVNTRMMTCLSNAFETYFICLLTYCGCVCLQVCEALYGGQNSEKNTSESVWHQVWHHRPVTCE